MPIDKSNSGKAGSVDRRWLLAMAATELAAAGAALTLAAHSQPAGVEGKAPDLSQFESALSPEVEAAKKNAFIMIPYGMFVLGVAGQDGKLHAGTVNWVMQSAYKEAFFTIGVRRAGELFGFPYADSLYTALTETKAFSLSFLGTDQADAARAFMAAVEIEGSTINGFEFATAMTGGPILTSAPAWLEARIEDQMEGPDHTLFLARVINAGNTVERELLRDRDATSRPRGWLSNDPDL